jgi:MFS family permease
VAGVSLEREVRRGRRLPQLWHEPAGRGYLLLAAMTLAFGLSMNTSNAVTTNYFADVLHFTGPQFGYITAIREVPGFLLILITALLYRMSQQRLTALALVVLGVGVAGYAVAADFWSVIPWVVLGSLGFHTVLQTQVSLGMSLSGEARSGRVLGVMAGVGQAGALVGMAAVLLLFLAWPDAYREVYAVCGVIAMVGAAAIVGFPHLHEGRPIKAQMPRRPIVVRRGYRYYYLLNVLDAVSLVVIVSTVVAMVFSPWAGRMIDRHGERHTLSAINVAYVFALAGYAMMGNAWLACAFYVLYSFNAPFSAIGAAT